MLSRLRSRTEKIYNFFEGHKKTNTPFKLSRERYVTENYANKDWESFREGVFENVNDRDNKVRDIVQWLLVFGADEENSFVTDGLMRSHNGVQTKIHRAQTVAGS